MHSIRKLRRGRLAVAAIAVVAAVPLVAANSASAASYAPPYDIFNNCPVDDPGMLSADSEAACIGALASGGTMKLGNMETELGPQLTSMGLYNAPGDPLTAITVPGAGGKTLDAVPVKVPGGLLNMMCPGDPAKNLITQICKTLADSALNKVTATAVAAGAPQFSLTPGPTVPIKIKLDNPLLGGNCYIGSDANPIVLNLALGVTDETELGPGTPIPGYEQLVIIAIKNATFSDDTFEVPKAKGCGPLNLFDGAINNRVGLPSPSGNNSIFLEADVAVADVLGVPDPGIYLRDALASVAQ